MVRLKKAVAIAAIIAALLVGLVIGGALGAFERFFGGGSPQTIATASLQSMRAQNRLNVFAARYVSVTSSRTSRFGLTAERTLILPGDVRYEVDLAKLQPNDVQWDGGSNTLRVRIPDIEIAGPEVDLTAAREYGAGRILSAFTNSETALDQANRAAAVADLRKQAGAETPMRLAREAARAAIARSFALPLQAAGHDDVKVVARFATEDGSRDPSYLDVSPTYEEAIAAAKKRRAREAR
jgi:hypothetical protein